MVSSSMVMWGSFFSKQFYPTFFSAIFKSRASFELCSFSNFLQSSISINSVILAQNTYQSVESLVFCTSEVRVTQCRFINCTSDHSGGGISVGLCKHDIGRVTIIGSLFHSCSARTGGAFFLYSTTDINQRNCVINCKARKMDSAFESDHKVNSSSRFETMAIYNCGLEGSKQLFGFSSGIIRIYSFNITHNQHIDTSCLGTYMKGSFSVHTMNYMNNSGSYGFFFQSNSVYAMESCHILNNKFNHSLMSIYSLDSSQVIKIYASMILGNHIKNVEPDPSTNLQVVIYEYCFSDRDLNYVNGKNAIANIINPCELINDLSYTLPPMNNICPTLTPHAIEPSGHNVVLFFIFGSALVAIIISTALIIHKAKQMNKLKTWFSAEESSCLNNDRLVLD